MQRTKKETLLSDAPLEQLGHSELVQENVEKDAASERIKSFMDSMQSAIRKYEEEKAALDTKKNEIDLLKKLQYAIQISDNQPSSTKDDSRFYEIASLDKRSTCSCGKENRPSYSKRISGGSRTAPNQYPWMVQLVLETREGRSRFVSTCGGSLISDRHVLTAYHCLPKSKDTVTRFYAKVGAHDVKKRKEYEEVNIKSMLAPGGGGKSHDIAIVVLQKPVAFNRKVQPVCLPKSNDFVYVGEKTMAMGWGMTHKYEDRLSLLKHVRLTVDSENGPYFHTKVDVIRGIPQDPCSGDSGGPLVHQDRTSKRWTIIGTVNGDGYDCRTGNTNGMGRWNSVVYHLKWIRSVLNKDYRTVVCSAPTTGTTRRVNGGWTDYSSWSTCACEGTKGKQSRSRTCTNPAPRGGGADCRGSSSKTRSCYKASCTSGKTECRDTSSSCATAISLGYCKESYWKNKCLKSCGACSTSTRVTTGSSCRDGNYDCRTLVRQNSCSTKFKDKNGRRKPLSSFCPKTCGTCNRNSRGGGSSSSCKDTSSKCDVVLNWNWCGKAYWKKQCLKSCRAC